MKPYRDHLDAIMTVMEAAFDPQYGEGWNRRQVEDALLSGLCHYQIIDSQGQFDREHAEPAGFCLSRHIANEEELLLIGIIPKWRGRGLGKLLIESFKKAALARGANKLFLEMREGNPALSLYTRCGFSPIGMRYNYYRNGSGYPLNAITFCCIL